VFLFSLHQLWQSSYQRYSFNPCHSVLSLSLWQLAWFTLKKGFWSNVIAQSMTAPSAVRHDLNRRILLEKQCSLVESVYQKV
jgi:hypothetical protein